MTASKHELQTLLDGLKLGERELIDRMAGELSAEPERTIPSQGPMSMLAGVRAAIAGVEAVIAEDAGGADEEA